MTYFKHIRMAAIAAIAGVLVVNMALSSPATAARGDKAAAEEYFRDARQYLKNGDANAAVIQLKNALQKDRNHVGARKLLGEIYLRVGNGPAAEKELKAARSRGVDGTEIQILIARAYVLQGKFDSVLKELKDDVTDAALRTDMLHVRGRAFLGLGMREDALASFSEAEKLQPEDIRPKLGLAKVLISMGKLAEAEEKVDAALAVEGDAVEALVLKGELSRLKQDLEGAVAAFNRAIEANGTSIPALLGRAAALIDLNRDEEAQADIATVYSRVPKQPLAGYLSALILAKKKDFAGAQEVLQQAAPMLDNHMPSVFLSGAINYALNQLEQAADQLMRYVAAVPANERARKLLGATLVRKKDMSGAIDVLRPLADSDKADAQVLALLGGAYMRTGKFAEGAELFEKAVRLAPDVSSIRTQLALSRLVQGAPDQAVGELEAAVDLDPEARQASILLTLVHLRQGRFDEALEAAETLRAAMPDNPLAYNLIGAARLGKGELAEARRTFETALQIKADFHPARMNLAQLDLRENNVDGAIRHYEHIIRDDPKHVRALLALADVATRQNREAEVVDWLKKASDANPKAIGPKLRLIRHYSEQRDFPRALAVARDLDARVPNNAQVLEILGRTEIAAGDRTGAVATFRRLTGVAGKAPRAHHLLGGALVASNDQPAARESFRQAIALDPDYVPAVMALSELESRAGNIEKAIRLADGLSEKQPNSAVGPMLAGDAYVRAENYDKALAYYAEAMKRENTGILALRIFNAKQAAGRTVEALAELQAWVNRNEDIPVRHVLTTNYIANGYHEEAIREAEKLMKVDGDNPVLLNNLAWLYDQKGDDRAVALAEKALEKAPNSPEIMDTLGWLLTRHGEVGRGVELLRNAHEAAPKQGDIAYHLAVALSTQGKTVEARRTLERILNARIDFSEAENARNLLRKLGGG